jgi:hypothetical protein
MVTLNEAVLKMNAHMLRGIVGHFNRYLKDRYGYTHVFEKKGTRHSYRWHHPKGEHFEINYDEKHPGVFRHAVTHVENGEVRHGAAGIDQVHDYYRRFVKIPKSKLFSWPNRKK